MKRILLSVLGLLLALPVAAMAPTQTSIEFGDRRHNGDVREEIKVTYVLASLRLAAEGADAVQCVGVLVEKGAPVRAWASHPVAARRAQEACVGTAPLFLGDSFFPGDAFFPGDMFYGSDELFPGDAFFPGDMFFQGDLFFPGDMFRRTIETAVRGGTGVVLFLVPEDRGQRRDLLIKPIIIGLGER